MKYSTLKATTFAALGTVFALAHASAQQPAPPPPIAGEYKLAQVDAAILPVLISETGTCKQEVTKAELKIAADGKYSYESEIKETCGEKTNEVKGKETGTVTYANGKFTFAPEVKVVPSAAAAEKASVTPPASMFTESSAVIDNGALKLTLKSNKVLTFKKD